MKFKKKKKKKNINDNDIYFFRKNEINKNI